MKKIAILGSTGSIGTQTLDVVREQGDISVAALASGSNIALLEQQIREFHPRLVAVWDKKKAEELKIKTADLSVEILDGMDGLLAVAQIPEAEILVTAIVGMLGIRPTIAAIRAGKDIALANKETLVTAGHLIMPMAEENHVSILPVDSEHSAIFQSLNGERHNKIHKILLTASGGPFRTFSKEQLAKVTKADALNHPTWEMGAKITIDSASMMNKGFEVIEAKWLFGVDVDKIQVLVHPQSIVHSAVQFVDGAVKAQLGVPDMRLPIQYAFSYPDRLHLNGDRLNLFEHPLEFFEPDMEKFRCLALAYEAMRKGGNMPCILNAANEIVNRGFLDDKCGFLDMPRIIEETMARVAFDANPSYDTYIATDAEARRVATELMGA